MKQPQGTGRSILKMACGAAICLCMALSSLAAARQPSFDLVPAGEPLFSSGIYGLSADGRTATGYYPGTSTDTSFTWTRPGGRNDVGVPPEFPVANQAFAISGDAGTICGMADGRAFRYRGTGTFQYLPTVGPYSRWRGTGANSNGSVIVGFGENYLSSTLRGQAFRWTQSGGFQALGFTQPGSALGNESQAWGVSRDGNTVVGFSSDGNEFEAFAWTPSGGIRALPSLVAGSNGRAYGVSPDGLTIVGASGSRYEATAWRDGIPTSLGLVPGFNFSFATCASSSSAVIGGFVDGSLNLTSVASVWTAETGNILLSAYLTRNGVSLPNGLTLVRCYSISDDGRTFAGSARFVDGPGIGFVATVPGVSSTIALLVGVGALTAPRKRQDSHAVRS